MKDTIKKLEDTLEGFASSNHDREDVDRLVSVAGEALGVLKAVDVISLTTIMYDMARLAAHAGGIPDDFGKNPEGHNG